MPFDSTDFQTVTVPAPVKPAIDNANLRAVRDLMANLRPEQVDMREPHTECGSPACIFGWARTIMADGDFAPPHEVADWMGITRSNAADLFGMPVEDKRYGFAPSCLTTNFNASRDEVVRTLDHLIATGEVRWDFA